jgi:hypothetical protein
MAQSAQRGARARAAAGLVAAEADGHVADALVGGEMLQAAPEIDDGHLGAAAQQGLRGQRGVGFVRGGDEHDVGILDCIGQRVGDEGAHLEGLLGVRSSEVVMTDHAVAGLGEGAAEVDAGGFLNDVGEGFVGEPQHGDVGALGQMGRQFFDVTLGEAAVVVVVGLEEAAVHAELPAHEVEGDIVAGKTGAAKTEAASEVFAADALVHAERVADNVDVSAGQVFAEVGEQVGEGDLHRHVAVDGDLRQFGVFEAHALHGRVVLGDAMVNLLEQVAGARIGFAQQVEIGIEKIADDGAEGDELGVVAETEIGAALLAGFLLEDGQQPVAGGAGEHGAGEDDDVVAVLFLQGLTEGLEGKFGVLQCEGAALIAGGGDNHEADVGSKHGLLGAQGGADALLVRGDHLAESSLLHGCLAGVDGVDGVAIDIDADDVEAARGHAGGHATAEFAETDNGNVLHHG